MHVHIIQDHISHKHHPHGNPPLLGEWMVVRGSSPRPLPTRLARLCWRVHSQEAVRWANAKGPQTQMFRLFGLNLFTIQALFNHTGRAMHLSQSSWTDVQQTRTKHSAWHLAGIPLRPLSIQPAALRPPHSPSTPPSPGTCQGRATERRFPARCQDAIVTTSG